MATTKYEMTLFDRLFDRTIVKDNGCWEFTGGRDKDGYGKICAFAITIPAHRLAYDLCVGNVPKGALVLHSCDNPPCVNPAHLRLGTHQNNTDDIRARGRFNPPVGSRQWLSKLTENDVKEIKDLLVNGPYSQREIARRYDVTHANIGHIKYNRRWAHLGEQNDNQAT